MRTKSPKYKKKTVLADLHGESNRKNRSMEARKLGRKKNAAYKDGNYPSKGASVKLKAWRDGWFSK